MESCCIWTAQSALARQRQRCPQHLVRRLKGCCPCFVAARQIYPAQGTLSMKAPLVNPLQSFLLWICSQPHIQYYKTIVYYIHIRRFKNATPYASLQQSILHSCQLLHHLKPAHRSMGDARGVTSLAGSGQSPAAGGIKGQHSSCPSGTKMSAAPCEEVESVYVLARRSILF